MQDFKVQQVAWGLDSQSQNLWMVLLLHFVFPFGQNDLDPEEEVKTFKKKSETVLN